MYYEPPNMRPRRTAYSDLPLDAEEEAALAQVKACASASFRTALAVMSEAGLEVHDCRTLAWDDVDFLGGRVAIPGKSARKLKLVRLPIELMKELSSLRLSRHPHADRWVFCDGLGAPWSTAYYKAQWDEALYLALGFSGRARFDDLTLNRLSSSVRQSRRG